MDGSPQWISRRRARSKVQTALRAHRLHRRRSSRPHRHCGRLFQRRSLWEAWVVSESTLRTRPFVKRPLGKFRCLRRRNSDCRARYRRSIHRALGDVEPDKLELLEPSLAQELQDKSKDRRRRPTRLLGSSNRTSVSLLGFLDRRSRAQTSKLAAKSFERSRALRT